MTENWGKDLPETQLGSRLLGSAAAVGPSLAAGFTYWRKCPGPFPVDAGELAGSELPNPSVAAQTATPRSPDRPRIA